MSIKQGFAKALRKARKAKGLSQEDFSEVSSRTYVSTLERGLYSPTLEKVEELANNIGIHPVTLISLAYIESGSFRNISQLKELLDEQFKNFV